MWSADGAAAIDREAVYRAHDAAVRRWVARLVGPSPGHEDLVHDVVLVVAPKLLAFRGEAALTTWLFRITRHVVRNHQRRRRIRRGMGFLEHPSAWIAPLSLVRMTSELERSRQRCSTGC